MRPFRGIRLVTFDVLYTILTPRTPIHIQYAKHFRPHLGELDPDRIKASFRLALEKVQKERPAYEQGKDAWWRDVIYQTALGAGANEKALSSSLSPIVAGLMACFSSKEGYVAYEDVFPTLGHLSSKTKVRTAVVSNADSRIRSVLEDLGFPSTLAPIILSEEEGVEKPSPEIFMRALQKVNDANLRTEGFKPIEPRECVHVGDELMSDYHGALGAGMNALLLLRKGGKKDVEIPPTVQTVRDLQGVLHWLRGEIR
ncbi:HAD-like protein [Pluteus cervinus]|uniref:HAD-like protein n=1 Tax=Pluteus cervinus TaxID=181527 RepID=A0ACD3B7T2_9AGAR|nr:HAD-like protein [Pluteus cervinus]